jgi:hypothetical protein
MLVVLWCPRLLLLLMHRDLLAAPSSFLQLARLVLPDVAIETHAISF